MSIKHKIKSILKEKGALGFAKFIFIRITSKIAAIPISFGILCVNPFIRIRLIKLFSSRIGHYSFNTEAIMCGLALNLDDDKKQKTFFYIPPGSTICNTQLHTMWKRTLSIIPASMIASEVDKLLQKVGHKKYRNDAIKKTFEPGGDGRDRWGLLKKINKCHLSFTAEEHQKAKILMNKLGIPDGSSFVCLLVRDSHYLNSYIPSGNWSYHDYRDADVNAYQKAAQYLADKGYYVIRMGKIVKEPFNAAHPNIIDYAVSEWRSDFLDVYLAAHCFFFLSTCTGLDSVARVFRKPLLVTNLGLPDFDIWHPWNLFIPKKMMDIKNDRIISFKEMNQLYQAMSKKQTIMSVLKEKNLRFIDNTQDEIADVVQEMLDKLENACQYSEDDEKLQEMFWNIFPRYLVNPNLPVLKIPVNERIEMRVGNAFLKQNKFLLSDHSNFS